VACVYLTETDGRARLADRSKYDLKQPVVFPLKFIDAPS